MKSLLKRTYDWTLKWSKTRYSLLALFLFIFIDASFFPLPTTIIFITLSLLYPLRANFNAIIATLAMGSGAIAGYFIGHYLWLSPDGGYTSIAKFFFNHIPGFTIEQYQNLRNLYMDWSYTIFLSAIILPVPYLVYSITAGAFDINVLIFGLSTLFFQGLRFFLLAILVITFGEGVKLIFHKNLRIIAVSTLILLIIYVISILIFRYI